MRRRHLEQYVSGGGEFSRGHARCTHLLDMCEDRGLMGQATEVLRTLIFEHDALKKGSKASGRKAGSPRGSKAKGREGVEAARQWILQQFPALKDGDLVVQTTSVGGSDIHLSPHAIRYFPFAPESKRVEKLNIWEALEQARINAIKRGLSPVLFFSRAHSRLFITFPAEDLAKWLEVYARERMDEMARGVLA